MKLIHNCRTNGQWAHCIVCDGRLHKQGCTTKRNPAIDCCQARHEQLHAKGQIRGLFDSSFEMLGTHNTW
jgi:hypothetical protein